jgi:nucleotide-binding universal stress UspA family protein
MQNIKRIIVPVDFQRHTDDIAEFAINIAKSLDAKPTFVHVVEHFAEAAGYADSYPTSFIEIDNQLYGYAQKKMAALLEQNKNACPGCAGAVLRGDAAGSIVAYIKEQKADLVIIGTHGSQGIEKILLGSVAERVLKRASCPILIFNPYKGDRGYQIDTPFNEAVQPL